MSYARLGPDSDVYVFRAATPRRLMIVCCWCSLSGESDKSFESYKAALAHMQAHRDAGYKVPKRAVDRLQEEDAARKAANRRKKRGKPMKAHAKCNEAARVNADLLSESEAARDKALDELAQARKERDEAKAELSEASFISWRRWYEQRQTAAWEELKSRRGQEAKITPQIAAAIVAHATNENERAARAALAGEKDSGREQPGQRPGSAAPCANSVAPAVPATGLELRPRWLNSVGTPEGYLSDAEWEAHLGRNPHDATAPERKTQPAPIPMVLHCPTCGVQHVDTPEPDKGWTNPPHKSHLCHGCGTIWRPADVPTNGVASVSRGKADTWPVGADEKPLPSQTPNEKPGPEFSPVAEKGRYAGED